MKRIASLRATVAVLAAVVFYAPAAPAAITTADLEFWIGPAPGPGISEAVMVLDWRDGAPGLAWGYRWNAAESRLGRDMLAAVAGADPRLTVQGLDSGFVSNFGFDANRDGTPERFRPGFDPGTGEFWDYFVNNEVYLDPIDFTKNGHVIPPATAVVPLGNPYDGGGPGRWVESSTGILDRPLVDGSWDGLAYAVFGGPGPDEPLPVSIPEPATLLLACLLPVLLMLRRRMLPLMMLLSVSAQAAGPYPPAAGQPASDAVAANDPRIKAWAADALALARGPEDLADPLSSRVTYGAASSAIGPADVLDPQSQPDPESPGPFPTVSLGDGGSIVLVFSGPIADGAGPDFAVFENALNDWFLELAFVEVSSDGVNFFRFPAISLTPPGPQVGTFGALDPRDLDNVAGKFRAGFGTPFDLADLAVTAPQLDRNAVTHVRIIDVVGSIDAAIGSRDSLGQLVNDPFPTPFESGGFDLDAVAVLNQSVETYSAWRSKWAWAAGDDVPSADPDHDGQSNAIEYVAGTPPLEPGPPPEIMIDPLKRTVRVPVPRPSIGDIAMNVEFSSDLDSWEVIPGSAPALTLPAGRSRGFVRLAVSILTP